MPNQRQRPAKDSKDKPNAPETQAFVNRQDLADASSDQSIEHSGLRLPMNAKQGKKRDRQLSREYLQIFS